MRMDHSTRVTTAVGYVPPLDSSLAHTTSPGYLFVNYFEDICNYNALKLECFMILITVPAARTPRLFTVLYDDSIENCAVRMDHGT